MHRRNRTHTTTPLLILKRRVWRCDVLRLMFTNITQAIVGMIAELNGSRSLVSESVV